MTDTDEELPPLRERIVSAAPFDQVGVVRWAAEDLPFWPADLTIEGEGALGGQLAELLSSALLPSRLEANLGPVEAREVAALLLPEAMSDPDLVPTLEAAADRQDEDDSLNAIELLTGAATLSFIILVATVEVDWRPGKSLRIVKKSLGDRTLGKLVDIVAKLVGLPS